jgi:iron complex outermembrane recepter protein
LKISAVNVLAGSCLLTAASVARAQVEGHPAPDDPEEPAELIPVAPIRAAVESYRPKEKEKRPQLEEIVVTAQKRAESLNKVPLAVSAFDQKSMEKVGANSFSNSTSLVPNLQNSIGGLGIRSTAPTVAMHVDGIYADDDPRGLSSNFDIARVEVLRGPQGTLYGRNATAGVVNIITAKPSEEFEAFGNVSYRSGNEMLARVVINQPVGESFGLRLATSYLQTDGLQNNPTPGESNAGAARTTFARLSTRWTLTPDVGWDANVEYRKNDSLMGMMQLDWYVSKPDRETAVVYPSGLPPDGIPPPGPGVEQFGSFDARNRGIGDSYNLRSSLRAQLSDRWAVTWLAGYGTSESRNNGSPFSLVLLDYTLRGNDSESRSDVQSHELDFNFEGERARGVAGLYYFRKRSESEALIHIWTPTGSEGPEAPPELQTGVDMAVQSFAPNKDESQAIFGQLTFDITAALRLTGGLRYTRDATDQGAGRTTFCPFGEFRDPDQEPGLGCQLLDQAGAFGGVFGPTPVPRAKRSWDALNWKLIADYDFTRDLLGYATASTGYKQGSITNRSATNVEVVEPESNTNYELGLRAQLLDGSANLNLTAFWMDYVDLQVSTSGVVNGAPMVVFTNVGKARIRGAEAEWIWQVTDHDRIDGYITYLDALITQFPNAPDPLRGEAFTFDAAGNRPSAAPEMTFRLAYSRRFGLGSWGLLTPTVSTYYASDAYIHYTNGPQDLNPSHWRSDVFVRYETSGARLSLEAFVNNLEDHHAKGSAFMFLTEASDTSPGGGMQWASYLPGRTMGLRLGLRF